MKPAGIVQSAIAADEPSAPPRFEGESAARLYRSEGRAIGRRLARRMPAADAEDLVQESFRRMLGHAVRHPGAFLNRVTHNLQRERQRTADRRAEASTITLDEVELADVDPCRQLEARDILARVSRALDALPEKTRNIFLLHRIEGLSYARIAAAYGMSEKGVEKQFAKAMLHLRRRAGRL